MKVFHLFACITRTHTPFGFYKHSKEIQERSNYFIEMVNLDFMTHSRIHRSIRFRRRLSIRPISIANMWMTPPMIRGIVYFLFSHKITHFMHNFKYSSIYTAIHYFTLSCPLMRHNCLFSGFKKRIKNSCQIILQPKCSDNNWFALHVTFFRVLTQQQQRTVDRKTKSSAENFTASIENRWMLPNLWVETNKFLSFSQWLNEIPKPIALQKCAHVEPTHNAIQYQHQRYAYRWLSVDLAFSWMCCWVYAIRCVNLVELRLASMM